MKLSELEDHVAIMLRHLMVESRKTSILKGMSTQYSVVDFGLVICCINRIDYAQISDAVSDQFKGWRTIFVTTNDNLLDVKYKVIWQLMRGGYMKWLRYKYPRQFKRVLNGPENFGNLIIKERLRIWNNQPKYKFFIDDNEAVLKSGILRELANDPGFFDYMPEEE